MIEECCSRRRGRGRRRQRSRLEGRWRCLGRGVGGCVWGEGGGGAAEEGVEEGARGVEEGGVAGGLKEDAERGCGGFWIVS